MTQSDNVFEEFYNEFCHCHKATGMMNFMQENLE